MPNTVSNPFVPQIEDQSVQCSFILDSIPALVFYINSELCFTYINRSFENWCGLAKEQVTGKEMKEILEADTYLRLKEFAEKALTGVNIDFQIEVPSRNGNTQVLDGSFKPNYGEAGQVVGFTAYINTPVQLKTHNSKPLNTHFPIQDTADEKLLNALRKSEERYFQLVNSLPAAIYTCDANGRILMYNEAAATLWGCRPKIGKDRWCGSSKMFDLQGNPINLEESPMANAIKKGQPLSLAEIIIERADGGRLNILANAKPILDETGKVVEAVNILVNVTGLKWTVEAEKQVELRTVELKQANLQLLRYNEELEQFAYAASHDLQEPLRKIQTFAGMLFERNYNELNESGKNYISKIIKSTERMSGIINDLLAYSRQSRVDDMFEETNMNEIIDNVVSDLELMIQQKEAQVICDVLPNIKAIPSQMNRLFYNLINNSLKFSSPDRPPKIHISVRKYVPEHPDQQPSFIEFIVRDNGIGFEQKYADRIFQLFHRLNDKHSYNGNGIGLALCKKIVQNHFGEISAEAKLQEGAIFHIKFPANLLVESKAVAM